MLQTNKKKIFIGMVISRGAWTIKVKLLERHWTLLVDKINNNLYTYNVTL